MRSPSVNRATTTTVVLAAAAVAAIGAGWFVLAGGGLAHPHGGAWSAGTFALAVVMWQAMMVAMMTPAVAPWVGVYARLVGGGGPSVGPTLSFAGGYFVIWLAYSIAAALLQLAAGTLAGSAHGGASNVVGGAVLIGAGIFQFTPVKQACLAHCRNPLSYLLSRWVDGPIGGFRLGLTHGAYCVGCCWLLMLTGLAVGLMNLAWMAMLTVVISLEQGMRGGVRLGRLFGAALVAWGVALCLSA
jgi:predicted metal-binding membrane protein